MQIGAIFSGITDPRIERKKLHLLEDILGLALLATICGSEGWETIEEFGNSKEDVLSELLELPNGIPSHDTIERLFKRINYREFEQAFIDWTTNLAIGSQGKLVSIDGKTVRGSRDGNKMPIHIVSAWCSENRLILGQYKIDTKSNEITAIKALLSLLDLTDSVITIDAIGCQTDIASQIVKQQGGYILAVKSNQRELYDDIQYSFRDLQADAQDIYITKDHGRIEKRTCKIILDLRHIENVNKWEGLMAILEVESSRHILSSDKHTAEKRYYITNLNQSAEYMNQAIKEHWSIENSLHWVLDVQMNEDHIRKRKGHAAENFSIIRKVALNLIKQKPYKRMGVQNRRLFASWNDWYLKSLFKF